MSLMPAEDIGGFADGQMALSRQAVSAEGQPVLQRMTWHNIAEDSLDWNWEVSSDNGGTWELRWRIHYVRR